MTKEFIPSQKDKCVLTYIYNRIKCIANLRDENGNYIKFPRSIGGRSLLDIFNGIIWRVAAPKTGSYTINKKYIYMCLHCNCGEDVKTHLGKTLKCQCPKEMQDELNKQSNKEIKVKHCKNKDWEVPFEGYHENDNHHICRGHVCSDIDQDTGENDWPETCSINNMTTCYYPFNMLLHVAIHEFAHCVCPDNGHTDNYWNMFHNLLELARCTELGDNLPRYVNKDGEINLLVTNYCMSADDDVERYTDQWISTNTFGIILVIAVFVVLSLLFFGFLPENNSKRKSKKKLK